MRPLLEHGTRPSSDNIQDTLVEVVGFRNTSSIRVSTPLGVTHLVSGKMDAPVHLMYHQYSNEKLKSLSVRIVCENFSKEDLMHLKRDFSYVLGERVFIETKGTYHKELKSVRCFTDGSFKEGQGGWAWSSECFRAFDYGAHELESSNDTEITAITQAKLSGYSNIQIYTDSAVALKVHRVNKVKGHSGVPGNVIADGLSRIAREGGSRDRVTNFFHSLRTTPYRGSVLGNLLQKLHYQGIVEGQKIYVAN